MMQSDPREGDVLVQQSAFWDDLARDLEDPEFRRAYLTAFAEIRAREGGHGYVAS